MNKAKDRPAKGALKNILRLRDYRVEQQRMETIVDINRQKRTLRGMIIFRGHKPRFCVDKTLSCSLKI